MRAFLANYPALAPLLSQVVRVQFVVDADIIQSEIRWRVGTRRDAKARTGLQEAIDSGVVVAAAPSHLRSEIEEHLGDIAADLRVPIDDVRLEWQEVQRMLLFYTPRKDRPALQGDTVDPDDVAYQHACEELGAEAVYSRDAHFERMQVPLVRVSLDLTLRKHARASSIVLGITLGSGTTVMIGFEAVRAVGRLIKRSLDAFDNLPGWAQAAIGIGVLVVILHPKLRAKVAGVWQAMVATVRALQPGLGVLLADIGEQYLTAQTIAGETYAEIRAALPKAKRRSALVRARFACLISKCPLTLEEIERRLRNDGYTTRSKDFRAYLRRVLRESEQFVEMAPNQWALADAASIW
jgi:hypothetical protein